MANTCTRCGLPAARFVEMGEIGNGGGPWPLRTESLCHECYEDLLRWLAVRLPTHCGNRWVAPAVIHLRKEMGA